MYMQIPNPNATPDLIERKLAKFETGLNNVDEKNKEGHLMVKERRLDECGQSFKLAFLRCKVFNVKNAVLQWVKYWDTRIQVFGEERAFLLITIDGAMKYDAEVFELGYLHAAYSCKADPDG